MGRDDPEAVRSFFRAQARSRLSGLVAVIVLLGLGAAAVQGGETEDEYAKRFRSLKRDDVAGHVDLASWLREKEAWDLLDAQCRHILRIAPNNRTAVLLRDMARAHRGGARASGGGGGGSGSGESDGRPTVLTDDQVQRIRRAELQLTEPERVGVRFERGLLREALDWIDGQRNFPFDRRSFSGLPAIERAQLLLRFGDDRFADGLIILGDPSRMSAFVREAWPVLAGGCATSGCHGGDTAGRLRLFGGRSLGTNMLYTNFLTLHEFEVGQERLVNRNKPERSLLLHYGLPPAGGSDAALWDHPTPITPVFPDRQDRDYRVVLKWLNSLAIEAPDYGIELDSDR